MSICWLFGWLAVGWADVIISMLQSEHLLFKVAGSCLHGIKHDWVQLPYHPEGGDNGWLLSRYEVNHQLHQPGVGTTIVGGIFIYY